MSPPTFDLGLLPGDVAAIREARRRAIDVDLDSAFRLIRDASDLVVVAVRARPLPSGPPFTLPGHADRSTG